MLRLLIFCCLLVSSILYSCTVTKRVHRPGYHIEWSNLKFKSIDGETTHPLVGIQKLSLNNELIFEKKIQHSILYNGLPEQQNDLEISSNLANSENDNKKLNLKPILLTKRMNKYNSTFISSEKIQFSIDVQPINSDWQNALYYLMIGVLLIMIGMIVYMTQASLLVTIGALIITLGSLIFIIGLILLSIYLIPS